MTSTGGIAGEIGHTRPEGATNLCRRGPQAEAAGIAEGFRTL